MRKCTLCVDRIYDERLPEADRQPACVLACPAHARHFGDYDDPESAVSKVSKGRSLPPMLEKLGYKPVNQYLAPREAPKVDLPAPRAKKSLVDYLRDWAGAVKED